MMTLTRANTEFIVVSRVSPLLTAAGMATTVIGSNADLNDPIGRAVRYLDHTVDDPTLVDDTDVARVTDSETDEFLDLTELFLLYSILGHLDDVDIAVGPRSEKLSQLAKQVEQLIDRLRRRMAMQYGYGLATPVSGCITRKFAEHE